MALTKVTGQVINDTTGLVVGVTTVGGGLSATDGFFSGIVTAVGNASFSGNVSVGGTLTYEDVTNIDAVGLVTARNGIVVGSGITLSKDGDGFFTGVCTATSFSGDGSNLTGISGVSVANQSDNRVITNTGTTDALNAEANLTFNGTRLDIAGSAQNQLQLNSTHSDGPNVVFQRSGSNLGYLGSAAANTGGTATDLALRAENNLTFASNGGNERLRIDSSGRMGLGITPTDYHSNNTAVFQLKDGNSIFSRTGGTFLGMFQNIKYNSSDVSQYVTSNPGSAYFQTSGEHKWYTAASGTADNNATLTERLHITSAGGLEQSGGVSSHYVLTNSGKAPNHIHIDGPAGNSGEMGGAISFSSGGTGCAAIAGLQQSSDADKIGLAFIVHQSSTASDDAIEAARFDNDGKFIVGRTGSITIASDPSDHNFEQLTDNGMALALHCDQANQRGLGIFYTASKNPADFIRCHVSTSVKFLVISSGNCQNANNSYGSISDISLKENIVDANSQWDDIKNIKVRNYNFKESVGYGTHTQIGVVAQELETVSPKLVEVSDKDGMKNVQYSVLYMKAVKALQEAMTRIETLEAKVAALEGS